MTAEWFEHGEVSTYVDPSGEEEFSGIWMPTPVVFPTVQPRTGDGSWIVSVFLGSLDDRTYGILVTLILTGDARYPDPLPQTLPGLGFVKVRVVYDPGRAVTE